VSGRNRLYYIISIRKRVCSRFFVCDRIFMCILVILIRFIVCFVLFSIVSNRLVVEVYRVS
jgi:hypothetical protein